MTTESKVAQTLQGFGVQFEMIDCDPDFADTAEFCEKYGYPPDHSANTILVASKRGPKKHAACVVLATTRLDVNHTVRDLMDVRRLSFASPEETAEVTGMMLGGVTPLNLPPGLPVYVDARIMRLEYVILGGGSRSAKIKVDPDVFNRLPGVQVIEGLANEFPA
ncbi:MAG: YbaK/EbsC family protein [Dehalococcoidia bacterium]